MVDKILTFFVGSQQERDLKGLLPILHEINAKEQWAMGIPRERYPEETEALRARYKGGETLEDLLPEAFALAREAARRTIGERAYDSQLLGGIVLHQGKVMEMKTGEGKTLASVAAAYLNSIPGTGVHIITVNDYLAERDASWMGPIYKYLGISVGAILANMDNQARVEAYKRDITYGTNNEFGFDYLRDNMRWDPSGRVQRSHAFAIIDEIDSILIDEARTPLIISGQAEDDTQKFSAVNQLSSSLEECAKDPETGEYPEEPVGDYKIDEKGKRVTFTDQGMNHIEKLLMNRGLIQGSLFIDENFEYIHYFTQAMKARLLFNRDVDYVIQDGLVQIVDEFTGRILHGRRYSDGLHQAIEAKEGITIAKRNRTLATITFQNFFRMYDKISGMTGTADTEAREFSKIYNLDVVVIPTNRPIVRADDDDVIFLNETDKFRAIIKEISEANEKGQPVLVGTVSIEKSELLATLLTKSGIRHEILNAKNHHREALIIAEAGAEGAVTIATNMAGRGTDIKLGGNPEYRARRRAGTEASEEEYDRAYAVEFEKWQRDYLRVKEAGGLYVIGTERHEARRIDNQLRGRSGRQGDPGRSRFFISLDDNLMRLFSDNLKPLMARVGLKDGEPIFHPWINKSIERAQGRVEERNFEIRKHLLDFDDVLNEQRTFIYNQRDSILSDNNLRDRVYTTAAEALDSLLEIHRHNDGVDAAPFLDDLRDAFLYTPDLSVAEVGQLTRTELRETVLSGFESDLKAKEQFRGSEFLNMFIRYEYLKTIDQKWQDHLENLEALREAVYLRSYGQKNPLLEYKLEGFEIFDSLIEDIRTGLAKKVLQVEIRTDPASSRPSAAGSLVTTHQQLGQFAGAGAASGNGQKQRPAQRAPVRGPSGSQATPPAAQVVRNVPKVGRNDQCPCGSGKKYKYCHGA